MTWRKVYAPRVERMFVATKPGNFSGRHFLNVRA